MSTGKFLQRKVNQDKEQGVEGEVKVASQIVSDMNIRCPCIMFCAMRLLCVCHCAEQSTEVARISPPAIGAGTLQLGCHHPGGGGRRGGPGVVMITLSALRSHDEAVKGRDVTSFPFLRGPLAARGEQIWAQDGHRKTRERLAA